MKINRRKLLSLRGAAPAILEGSAAATGQKTRISPAETEPKFEGLNPHGMFPAIQLVPMAQRLANLDNKTIHLVSDGFPGADHLPGSNFRLVQEEQAEGRRFDSAMAKHVANQCSSGGRPDHSLLSGREHELFEERVDR
jgi:hypothetical protein